MVGMIAPIVSVRLAAIARAPKFGRYPSAMNRVRDPFAGFPRQPGRASSGSGTLSPSRHQPGARPPSWSVSCPAPDRISVHRKTLYSRGIAGMRIRFHGTGRYGLPHPNSANVSACITFDVTAYIRIFEIAGCSIHRVRTGCHVYRRIASLLFADLCRQRRSRRIRGIGVFLGDVLEMLVLFAAAIVFVAAILKKEATAKNQNQRG